MAKRNRAKRPESRALTVVERKAPVALSAPDDGRGWVQVWSGGPYTPWQLTQGFQLDIDHRPQRLFSNWVVFACQTLIAGDIAKLRISLQELTGGVWQDTTSHYDRLFRKPNAFQIWHQFIECWSLSKQGHGNTYVLKERDLATRVRALYVLDPCKVTPLVAETDGSVYYRLNADDIAGIREEVVVPASEIMHDRFNCLFHQLVGLSPLYASALAGLSGLIMQEEALRFFRNGARPSGVLTAPQPIPDELAKQYKDRWETNYSGTNAGRTAVLGSGLAYAPINRDNAVDSDLTAQMKLSAEMVCSTHHVPAYKVGVGSMPTYQNAEVLNQIYYDDCLQKLIEAIEGLIDDGLELSNVDGRTLRAQFDLDGLLRMDTATKIKTLSEAVRGGLYAPNEARAKLGAKPKPGGDSVYLQQQNYSLEALAKRDASDDPFGTAKPEPAPPAPADKEDDVKPTADEKAAFVAIATKAAQTAAKDLYAH